MSAITDTDADNALLRLLLMPEGRHDPYPFYRELQERAPVLRSSLGFVVLTRYADCLATLRNPRLGRGAKGRATGELPQVAVMGTTLDEETRAQFYARAGSSMLFADPPDHTRLRGLVSRAFTPQRVARLRPAVERLVAEQLDSLPVDEEVDVMTALAFPLPVAVIGELVGVPPADRAGFQPLVRAAAAGVEPAADADTLVGGIEAYDEMSGYFTDLLAARRKEPADDLLTALAHARESDDALLDREIVGTAILLFAAGFETTTNLIGNGLLALLQHPDQLRRWREDPSLSEPGVEEILRYDSPVQINMRTALEAAEVAGEGLARGEIVIMFQGAANRDPERFDDPDTFDVGRAGNAPLSFGWGAHHCIGAALARLEGQLLFRELLERFASIELLVDEPEWRSTLTLRGLASLPVRLSPSR
jgi:cytochrome P450